MNTYLPEEMLKYENIFLIIDVDGYELALLNNELNSKLNGATMIIECHNHCYENMETDLINRFKDTHIIKSIPVRKADYNDYPNPNFIYKLLLKNIKNFQSEKRNERTKIHGYI